MSTIDNLKDAVAGIVKNWPIIKKFANGTATETVDTDAGTIPTISKLVADASSVFDQAKTDLIAQKDAEINQAADGLFEQTRALANGMEAELESAQAAAAEAVSVVGTKTSGLGDWSPESAVLIKCGDSTTEQMGGAGYGFDTLTSKWRVSGMPLAGLLGVVNFGGSGYRLRNFVTDAIQAGFTGPTGDLPGVSAGPAQWDYYGHKPAGSVSLDTALDWRGKLPSKVKIVGWTLCFGINDLILYNDVGTGTPAQIGAYIAGYLKTAVQKIQAKYPNDLVVLRIPNTMTSRPYNPAAGFPSQTAYPTFGNDAAPIAVPRTFTASDARALRNRYLDDVVWMVGRHWQQSQLGTPTTLTAEKFTELLQYIDELRNVPQQDGFPGVITWPVCPVPIEP